MNPGAVRQTHSATCTEQVSFREGERYGGICHLRGRLLSQPRLHVWEVSSSVRLVGRKKLVTEDLKMKSLFPSSPGHWYRGKWCLARCAQELRV